MKNSQCFLYITTKIGYNKEGASQQIAKVRTRVSSKKDNEYVIETIKDNAVYNKIIVDQIPGL